MAKTKKTFSLDEKVIARLDALSAAAGLSSSAYLAVLINQATEKQQELSVKGAE